MSEIAHNPCATCGACCRSYLVPVCGYDVWLIATSQRLGPEQFVVSFPQEEPDSMGFQLSSDEQHYGLALDKQGKFELNKPCVFLVQLGEGHARCGIYPHRPSTCRAYPMGMWRGVVFQHKTSLCPPGSWSARELVRPSWRQALQRLQMHVDIYREVIARWNARVMNAPAGREFNLYEYYNFLMNVYDHLGALDAAVGEEGLAGVQAAWPTGHRFSLVPEEIDAARSEVPWLDYLCRARAIIDTFYPEIPPLPMLLHDPDEWSEISTQARRASRSNALEVRGA